MCSKTLRGIVVRIHIVRQIPCVYTCTCTPVSTEHEQEEVITHCCNDFGLMANIELCKSVALFLRHLESLPERMNGPT